MMQGFVRKIRYGFLAVLAAVLTAALVSGCGAGRPGQKEGGSLESENPEGNESPEENGRPGGKESSEESETPEGDRPEEGKRPGEDAAVDGTTAAAPDGTAGSEPETAPETEPAPEPEPTPLPPRYDARADGRTAPVQDQGDLGTCWAFASLLALENSLLPDEVWDFSEDHMSHNPNFSLSQEKGGEYTMSMAYLLSWLGPVTEEADPYGDGHSPDDLSPVKHVQEIQLLPEGDRDAIKRAVLACGGVQSSLYTTMRNQNSQSEYYNRETRAYCYPDSTAPNHDVVIVGWDDDFPREAFPVEVEGDGAFLCENSWGSQFGEDGFFYVSYYDGNLGKTNIAYTGVEDPDNYDHIYQSDLCGWIGQLGYGEETAWAANVYVAGEKEQLGAVGFYATQPHTAYQLYRVSRVPEEPAEALAENRVLLAEGLLENAGYYTVPFTQRVHLEAGERFAVIIRLTTPEAIHPIAIEYDAGDGKSNLRLDDGEGYISPDGQHWERVEKKQHCNLCLKAYTRNR